MQVVVVPKTVRAHCACKRRGYSAVLLYHDTASAIVRLWRDHDSTLGRCFIVIKGDD